MKNVIKRMAAALVVLSLAATMFISGMPLKQSGVVQNKKTYMHVKEKNEKSTIEDEIDRAYMIPDTFIREDEEVEYNGAKTYESTDKITYGLAGQLNRSANADSKGFMKVDDRYLVAIGTSHGIEIGQWFDIILENGNIIPCIMGDTKADCDTDESNTFTSHSKCATEFIVKTDLLGENAKWGDVSKIVPGWDSKVKWIISYDNKWENEG